MTIREYGGRGGSGVFYTSVKLEEIGYTISASGLIVKTIPSPVTRAIGPVIRDIGAGISAIGHFTGANVNVYVGTSNPEGAMMVPPY